MVSADGKINADSLREVKVLQIFSDDELNAILNLGKIVSYEAYANIVIEGEMSWGLYLLLEGTAGIFKTNQMSGNTYDIAQLQGSNFFGEMSLVDEGPRSATVRALTDCRLLYISKEAFNGFLTQSPDRKMRFYEACIRILVNRLKELDDNYVVTQYQLWKTALTKDRKDVA